jgi:hypothetical protein
MPIENSSRLAVIPRVSNADEPAWFIGRGPRD